MLPELLVLGQVVQHLFQGNDADHRHAVVPLHLLDGRQLALPSLLTIERDQHAGSLCFLGTNDLHHLSNGGAGCDHVVDYQYPSRQRRTDQRSAFTVILGFLAIEAPGQIAAMLLRQSNGSGGGQGNALVGWPENHVEVEPAVHDRRSIEVAQSGKSRTTVE